jgi:hypothetical protein
MVLKIPLIYQKNITYTGKIIVVAFFQKKKESQKNNK